ncbi:kinase-like protein [Marasmius fiardii PR-910]|nr:kinase-like protein [Marasmius fiardii PR-910]
MRLLVKLSESQDILPACLFIKGVKRQDLEAFYGGTFGDIYRARYRNEDVALKRIRVFQNTTDRHKIVRGLCREALLWRTLKHPFVLPFRGMDNETFPSLLCLISPWMKNGTILKHLRENGREDVEKRLFEIAQGLAYLHSQHIIHGDLRGSNILVDDDWHARLADFGLAVFSDATVGTSSSHHAGSVRWMAPELHHPQSFGLKYFRRTFASDVYSFACVCVELYTGRPPFADIPHDPAALLQVMAGVRPSRPMYASSGPGAVMPDYLWDLVQLCWSHNRAQRPCMTKVVALMQAGNSELVPVVRFFIYLLFAKSTGLLCQF